MLRWFGHVERMDDERLLKKVVNARVDGRAVVGRPGSGWMNGVEKALMGKMDVWIARECLRNKNEWRRVIRQFCKE